MSDHLTLVNQFMDVTGASKSRAEFLLDAANWNFEVAVGSFYDQCDDEREVDDDIEDVTPMGVGGASRVAPPTLPAAQPAPPAVKPRFATLSQFESHKDEDSDEEGQAFFAGGSERSGQQILGPSKNKKNLVEEMFKAAKEHGAEVVDPNSTASASRPPTFKGTGYRLGQSDNDTQVLPSQPAASMVEPEVRTLMLKMWKTGFSIDDGPLREYTSPENQEFLNSVKRGEVPQELLREARGGKVELDMEDHHAEDFVAPKKKVKPFTGSGHMLGSPAPTVVGQSNSSASSQVPPSSVSTGVDNSQPTTNVRIRLSDGTNLTGRFNHSQTVADICNYIVDARPQYAASTFVLLTTFPNKELTDPAATLKEANLLNASIVQRLK